MLQSKIKNELENMIEYFNFEDSEFTASIKICSNFSLFPVHFPENPILPGFCQIQLILVAFNKIYNKNFLLHKINRAKFYNIVTPADNIFLECSFSIEDSILYLKAIINKKDSKSTKISFLKLTASLEEEL